MNDRMAEIRKERVKQEIEQVKSSLIFVDNQLNIGAMAMQQMHEQFNWFMMEIDRLEGIAPTQLELDFGNTNVRKLFA